MLGYSSGKEQKRGQVIDGLNMMTAAHALSTDMVLLTNNTKEFQRVEGLELENRV